MKISLTEALAKLKLYNKKIEKATNVTEKEWLMDYVKGEAAKGEITHLTYKELKDVAEAKLQKVRALIANRNKLKGAIAQANASTKVNVAGKDYTIVQAIERKNSIYLEKEFLDILKNQVFVIKTKVAEINERAQQKANDIVEAQVQAEVKNKKTEEVEALYNLIYNKNRAEILDPLNIEKMVEEIEEEIELFEQEVDVALSIVNAKTEIEVDI